MSFKTYLQEHVLGSTGESFLTQVNNILLNQLSKTDKKKYKVQIEEELYILLNTNNFNYEELKNIFYKYGVNSGPLKFLFKNYKKI